MTQFDAVILGGGPGGYTAAIRCAQLGMKTALVESKRWGGAFTNERAVPIQALLHNAEIARVLTHEKQVYGISGEVAIDYASAHARSEMVADRMAEGIRVLLRKNKITEYPGQGIFRDAHTLAVGFDTGVTETLTFSNGVIAVGARPKTVLGARRGPRVWSSEDMVAATRLPSSVIICGAGPAGVEFACLLASYGTQVTVVERADRILPGEDPEASAELSKSLRTLGITVMTRHNVIGIDEDDRGGRIRVVPGDTMEELTLAADVVLMALGCTPTTLGYGLDTTGVSLATHGGIAVDNQMRTTSDGLFAVGDVTGGRMLASVAQAQGIVAAEAMAGVPTQEVNEDMTPHVTCSHPQVASFGYTEAQARDRGHTPVVSKFPLAASSKAWALGQGSGFIKIVADATHGEILGAHMVGAGVGELLSSLTLAQMWDLTAEEVARATSAQPTISAAVDEAARGVRGRMITF